VANYQDGIRVAQDTDKAIYWYEKAAKQGSKYARKVLDKYKSQE
jgi:TPR repeat protein